MKNLQALAIAVAFGAAAPMAMATSAGTSDSVDSHATNAPESTTASSGDSLRSTPSTAPAAIRARGMHPVHGSAAEPAAEDPVRAPFWQALLPGSIQ